MKVEIGKEKENGTKYTATVPSEKGVVTEKFDSWRGLRHYVEEMRKQAQESGQTFELVRKTEGR